jgi:hypothetical protein
MYEYTLLQYQYICAFPTPKKFAYISLPKISLTFEQEQTQLISEVLLKKEVEVERLQSQVKGLQKTAQVFFFFFRFYDKKICTP